MTTIDSSLFVRALKRLPVSRTPVWLMRQAGRYLPEYRKTRAVAGDFLSLCKNKTLACEVTLQPLHRFSLDAAILFSDILTIPDAMGLGLYFAEGEGPRFHRPLHSKEAIEQVQVPKAVEQLSYVFDAVRLIRQELPSALPLIGFSGSPWTLACYMVEGESSTTFGRMLNLVETTPALAHLLLEKLTCAVLDYLTEQVKAGADVLMLFDTWGGLLSTAPYLSFSLHYMQSIVRSLKNLFPNLPIILFTKGGGQWLEHMASTGCDALSVDWTSDLKQARQWVGHRVALQGNMAPSLLLADDKTIREEVKRILTAYGPGTGHVFNLGHGITPDISPDKVRVMLDALHELSPAFHGQLA